MEASIHYLMRILDAEIGHAEKIFSFLREKERVLIHNDSKGFRDLTMREQHLFLKSRELEGNRVSIVKVISKKLNIRTPLITLKTIAEHLDGKLSLLVKDKREQFLVKIRAIKDQNKKCDRLLKKTIEMVNHSLDLLSGKLRNKNKAVYGENLRIDLNYSSQSRIDQRV